MDDSAQGGEEESAPAGPRYDKTTLLQFFGAMHTGGSALAEAAQEVPEEQGEPAGDLSFKVEERSAANDSEEGGRTCLRRMLREQKKAAKRAAAAEVGGEQPLPEASVSGASQVGAATPSATHAAPTAQVEQTPWSANPTWPGTQQTYGYAAAMAAQVADAHRRAVVAARAVAEKDAPPLDEYKKKRLREQMEYYYSTDNLCKDTFLRSHMNAEGWIPLVLIAAFPKVKEFNVTEQQILEALKASSTLEVDGSTLFIRLKNENDRAAWTKAPSDYRPPLM